MDDDKKEKKSDLELLTDRFDKFKYETEHCLERAVDRMDALGKAIDNWQDRAAGIRLFMTSTFFGLSAGTISYLATRYDGWTSMVDMLGLAVAVGAVGMVVSVIWMAILSSVRRG